MTGIYDDSLTTYPLIRYTHADRYNATKIITNSLLERTRGRDGDRDLWVGVVTSHSGGNSRRDGGGAGSTEFTGVLDKCFGFFLSVDDIFRTHVRTHYTRFYTPSLSYERNYQLFSGIS